MAQVWLVTASSRGLGHAIVEAGLAAGNKVLATARDIKSLTDLSERGPACASQFSRGSFGQGAAPSGEPGREGVHEHSRHERGHGWDRRQWRARSGRHGVVECGRACVSRRPMARSGHGQVGKGYRELRPFRAGAP